MAFIGLSDDALAIFVPRLVFWCYCGMYELFSPSTKKYRLFPREEEDEKNLVSRWEAVKGVLFNQACQIAFEFTLLWMLGTSPMGQPPLYVQAAQFVGGILVTDAWIYFSHRLYHTNQFLYKHIHAKHHHLVVPYAIGAQYQHPLEFLTLDGMGITLGCILTRMTARTTIFFGSFSLMKSIDDHTGLWLPWNPFRMIFTNNSAFHTVHHQLYGGKANFSAPFFNIWDKIMGTYMPYTVEVREEGGYLVKPVKKMD